jgi:hypothetical protein
MVTAEARVESFRYESDLRSWLEYARRSAGDAYFVLGPDVGTTLGRPTKGAGALKTDRDLVQFALDFANSEVDDKDTLRGIELGKVDRLAPGGEKQSAAQEVAAYQEAVEKKRRERRAFFADILIDRSGVAAKNFSRVQKALEAVWLLPSISMTRARSGFVLGHHTLLFTVEAFEAYVDTLLLDDANAIGGDLCQCRLQECGKFFLSKKPATGRPQRFYCSEEHMLKVHQQASPERRKRAQAKKAQMLKSRRRSK